MHVQGEEGDTVYEWMVREDGGGWGAWRDRVPKWIYPANAERPNFSQLLIPTADSVRYEPLLRLVFSVGKVCAYFGCGLCNVFLSPLGVCLWSGVA